MNDKTPQRTSGKARAEQLFSEGRKEIERRGAIARWTMRATSELGSLPKTVATGVLRVGNIACAVLDDDDSTRVLT